MRGSGSVGPCSCRSWRGTVSLRDGLQLGCNVSLQGQMQEAELPLYVLLLDKSAGIPLLMGH